MHPRFAAATLGVKIVSLDTGKTLFEHNAEKFFSPASNTKLYTMALALDKLGGDYRIKTSLYARSKPDRFGTLKGDLIVHGRGAPDFNARLHGDNIYQALAPLVAVLTNAGVKRITGDLVGDEGFFRGPPYGSGWAWDDMENYYGAEISALTINDNVMRLSVKPGASNGAPCNLALSPATTYLTLNNRTETIAAGGRRNIRFHRPIEQNVVSVTGQMPQDDPGYSDDVTVHNPAGLFVALFQEALARQKVAWSETPHRHLALFGDALVRRGISIGGKLRTVGWRDRQVKPLDLEKLVELGAVESLPMRELVREVQKPSQNLYTDLVLAHIGAREQERQAKPLIPALSPSDGERTASGPGAGQSRSSEASEEAGIRELQQFLIKAGVPRGEVQFEEGSGLSRNNLTTPNATIALLQFMSRHAEAGAFLNALPIAGVDGTLRNRMKNTPAAGNVRAKTGTLRWANALSGHVKTAAGERLLFSIMLNRYIAPGTEHSGRAEIDRIAVMLAGFTERSDARDNNAGANLNR